MSSYVDIMYANCRDLFSHYGYVLAGSNLICIALLFFYLQGGSLLFQSTSCVNCLREYFSPNNTRGRFMLHNNF